MIEAYPLRWPEGWQRSKYRRVSKFRSPGFGQSRNSVIRQLKLMGGRHVVISSNIPLRLDGLPYANYRTPDDPGIAVYWLDRDGKQQCIACDRWKTTNENIHAISKTIDALRGIERWGSTEVVERAFRGFAALPPSGDDWRTVLGLDHRTHYSLDFIKTRYRELAARMHPDRGGNPSDMVRLNQAWEAAQKAVS